MAGLLARDGLAIGLESATGLDGFSSRNGWALEHWRASAQLLHQRPILADQQRRASLLELTRPALVLGSTTSIPTGVPTGISTGLTGMELGSEADNHFGPDASIRAGSSDVLPRYDIVRRRSGGGLVWLDPAEATWLDVFVPVGDTLWRRDVAHSFEWLGKAIAEAFVSFGAPARAHQGEFEPGPADGLICFGSLGHGEVVVDESSPRKLVGISQRRTRLGSRFQCLWYRHFTLGAITQLARTEDCEATTKRACGWSNLGSSFDGITSLEIAQRVIAHLTNA